MDPFSLEQVSGKLAIDFVNTVGLAGVDGLKDYAGLLAWARPRRLAVGAAPEELEASEALRVAELARRIREILREIFLAVAERRPPEGKRLAQLNAALSAALDRLEVRHAPAKGFSWAWTFGEDELERPLWPVLWSAALLLTGGEARRLRRCAGRGCGQLFVDRSRRGNRRWCSMGACGNREKARRHSARLRRRRKR